MKLTRSDKAYLLSVGCPESDFRQIEEAAGKTVYEHFPVCGPARKISRETAVELLGREKFLSGLCRSAFHWSAMRTASDGSEVYFDSSRYFK